MAGDGACANVAVVASSAIAANIVFIVIPPVCVGTRYGLRFRLASIRAICSAVAGC